jgi:hypothetical protein
MDTAKAETRLEDIEQIRSLPNRYAHAMWQSDYESYGELFAEDGVVAETGLGLNRRITGRRELEALAKDASSHRKPRPLIHNHVIEFQSPNTAIGYAYVEVLDGLADYTKQAIGYYRDEYAKIDGAWKFARRDLTFVWGSSEFLSRLKALE